MKNYCQHIIKRYGVFYNKYFAKDKILTDILYGLADKRGPENKEQQKEIEGLADLSKLPLKFVQGIQIFI